METVRLLLISTYDLGRQPFGLASPAAWLRREGIDVDCLDTRVTHSRSTHRGGRPRRVLSSNAHRDTAGGARHRAGSRQVNPSARLFAYGLYAPLNANWLREQGVEKCWAGTRPTWWI